MSEPQNAPGSPAPAPNNPPAADPPSPSLPAAPPAAQVVLEGEDVATLKAQLEEERKTRRERETRVSELEDENRQLKDVTRPAPVPKPKKKLGRWTFFDEEEA